VIVGTNTPAPGPSPQVLPPQTGFTIDFIDVGQGDATFITIATGETILIDGGRSRERIREMFDLLGVTDLDAIAMTHPDADHIAGLIEALDLYPIERIYLNGGDSDSQTFEKFIADSRSEGALIATVSRGDKIELGAITMSVLHPGPLSGDSNVDSMVLLLDCGDVEVLLMADAEELSESSMLAAGVLMDIDVLKVGHHGSKTSTLQAFLDAVRPEVGVISAGLNNQYGHPHPEVVDRLNAAGAQVVMTDTTDGVDTVRMTSDCRSYEFQQAS
jgi:beta-lactamase superfamily II metal-dependent hydrolase